MRKITRLLMCMMACTTVMLASCNKDETSDSTGGNGSPESGEGIYLGIIGFNDQLYVKDISKLNQSTVYDFTGFINDLTPGNGTGLYYADYMALKKMNECTKPPKLKNVALVTFTDGLDNVSLANDALNPENYNSTAEYREALHNKIINDQVHGLNISAYTIGLKGSDVSDNAMFMENLRKLASNDNNVFQVANMDEAMQRFREIAENLYSVSTSVNLGVNVPGGYDDGQVLRFTFDNASAATNSSKYIEATYRRSNGRTLESISYHGLAQGATTISSSSSQGTYYQFLFEDLKYADGTSISQADINRIMLWKKTSTGGWDRESEFDPASSSNITEDKSSALIMLVLDYTNSLGNDFRNMQQSARNFVNTLANSNSGDNHGGSDPDPEPEWIVDVESFESGTIPSTWMNIDNDGDGRAWYVLHNDNYNYYYITSQSNNGCDDIIVTPEFTVPNSGNVEFAYLVSGYSGCSSAHSIYVGRRSGNTFYYEDEISNVASVSEEWVWRRVSLNDYRGQTISVAIRHQGNGASALFVGDIGVVKR